MSETWTVLRLLTWCREYFAGKGIDNPRLDAEVLLANVMGVDRLGLYLRYDQPLEQTELERFRDLVRRRASRIPVAHLLGTKEFYGLSFLSDARALVPRPETELLVDIALGSLPSDQPLTFCEVGVGTGCVTISLLAKRPTWQAVAVDLSGEAIALAAQNAERHAVTERLQIVEGDLFAGQSGPFAAVLSNPPYIPTADCPNCMPEVARHDPLAALDGGIDGLNVIRRLIAEAADRLVPGGLLAFEVGAGQAEAVSTLLAQDGRYREIKVEKDLAGIPRVFCARKKES